MPLPVVRSRDEAHLFMDLHPCERCHSVDVTWQSALTTDAGAPARRYHGTCTGCGAQREFVFRLPERPALPGRDDLVFLGGPESSELFDPGEWRLIADTCIQDASATPTGDPVGDEELKRIFALGVAAYAEILKFIPEGADAVPESAFRTPHGRATYEDDPGLFDRARLERQHEGLRAELEDRFRA